MQYRQEVPDGARTQQVACITPPSFPRSSSPPLARHRLTLLVALAFLAPAAYACDAPVGRLSAVEGTVEIRAAETTQWQNASARQLLCPGDSIAARQNGRVAFTLANDAQVRLGQQSELTLTSVRDGAPSELALDAGIAHVFSRAGKPLNVVTPHVKAIVDGAEFTVIAERGRGQITVAEGRVRAVNAKGEMMIASGGSAEVDSDLAPQPLEVAPLDAVRWAIHYPQIIVPDASALDGIDPAHHDIAARAIREAGAGHYTLALFGLESIPPAQRNARLQALHASLLLAIGNLAEARTQIARLDPQHDADAAALDALTRLFGATPADAQPAAERAIALAPASAAPQLAASYALQAGNKLDAALAAATRATELEPQNAVAWARRAELELAAGHSAEARAAAQHALTLNADTPRAGATIGFVDLIDGNSAAAEKAFDAAVANEAGDPLGWYGRGLLRVSQGQIADGRRDIETATLLDPTNAELRSYLALAYTAEGRNDQAAAQFDQARWLDPQSPTPWYFEAIRRERANDPVGAQEAYREALARNDNRAVIRPLALLDADRAARMVGIARSWQSMGFDQAARDAARDAVMQDPQSAAAHRQLAEAYASDPRLESARLSEVLQAQLRQPIGSVPIAPQNSVPGLPMVSSPRTMSADENTGIFTRSPDYFAGELLAGNQHITGETLIASHATDRTQISIGHFGYDPTGPSPLGDTRLATNRLDLGYALTPSTTLYGELRQDDKRGDDLTQRLVDTTGITSQLKDIETSRARIAFRTQYSPTSELIGMASYLGTEQTQNQASTTSISSTQAATVVLNNQLHSDARQLGMLASTNFSQTNIQAGFDIFRSDGFQANTIDTTLKIKLPFGIITSKQPTQFTYANPKNETNSAYLYADTPINEDLNLYFGSSYHRFHQEGIDSKDGMLWKIGTSLKIKNTVFRLATFDSIQDTTSKEQSLEPTNFAGFVQNQDEAAGTRSRNIALGISKTINQNIKGGIEIMPRRLYVPASSCTPAPCRSTWSERDDKVWLTYAISRTSVAEAEFVHLYRTQKSTITANNLPFRSRTEQISIGFWQRLSSKIDSKISIQPIRQSVTLRTAQNTDAVGSDHFWLTNLQFGYKPTGSQVRFEMELWNLFDSRFRYQNTSLSGEPSTPQFYAGRTVILRADFNF